MGQCFWLYWLESLEPSFMILYRWAGGLSVPPRESQASAKNMDTFTKNIPKSLPHGVSERSNSRISSRKPSTAAMQRTRQNKQALPSLGSQPAVQ